MPTSPAARTTRTARTVSNVVPLESVRRRGAHRVVRQLSPAASITSVQGSLALDLDAPPAPAAVPAPDLRLLAPAAPGQVTGDEPDPVHVWATQFAQALVEVAVGVRPAAQLLRATSRDVYRDLERRYQLLTAQDTRVRSVRHARPQVRSVHVRRTHVYAAEISVVVQRGERCRAIAIRAERREGRWQATDVQFG